MVTPELATQLLESNKQNRPLSQLHVQRIAGRIAAGQWQYNGDTIKVANNGEILDGQHRLWAIIEANKPVETIVVNGIEPGAFTTIDTLRKPRVYSDIVAMCGNVRHRNIIASALMWFIRWERGTLATGTFKAPKNRIENEDIKVSMEKNPHIVDAVEKTARVRRIANQGVMACFYYVLCCHEREDLADRMLDTLEDPVNVGAQDPFFRLRAYFLADHHKRKDHVMTMALLIKAANAAHAKKKIEVLSWKCQGKSPEAFPILKLR